MYCYDDEDADNGDDDNGDADDKYGKYMHR